MLGKYNIYLCHTSTNMGLLGLHLKCSRLFEFIILIRWCSLRARPPKNRTLLNQTVHKIPCGVSSKGCLSLSRFWTCISFNSVGLLVFCPYCRNFVKLACTKESQAHIRLCFVSGILPLVPLTDFFHLYSTFRLPRVFFGCVFFRFSTMKFLTTSAFRASLHGGGGPGQSI